MKNFSESVDGKIEIEMAAQLSDHGFHAQDTPLNRRIHRFLHVVTDFRVMPFLVVVGAAMAGYFKIKGE